MSQGRLPLRSRGGVPHAIADPRTGKLTPQAFWALWALLAGIAVGLFVGRLLGG